jgi:hypothetical protein
MVAGKEASNISPSDVRVEISEINWGKGFTKKSCDRNYRAANAFVKKGESMGSCSDY